jgi:hypothetical protein
MSVQNEKESVKKQDPLSGMTGGLILIVLGVLFLLAQQGYISWNSWWAYFLVGLGLIFILESLIRITRSEPSGRYTGKLIGGAVLLVIGASNAFGMVSWWPLILIVIGVFLLFSSFKKQDN